jgi:hypothetical protein
VGFVVNCHWDPPRLPFNGPRGGGAVSPEMQWLRCESHDVPSSSTTVKNERSYTPTPQNALMAWATLPLCYGPSKIPIQSVSNKARYSATCLSLTLDRLSNQHHSNKTLLKNTVLQLHSTLQVTVQFTVLEQVHDHSHCTQNHFNNRPTPGMLYNVRICFTLAHIS